LEEFFIPGVFALQWLSGFRRKSDSLMGEVAGVLAVCSNLSPEMSYRLKRLV